MPWDLWIVLPRGFVNTWGCTFPGGCDSVRPWGRVANMCLGGFVVSTTLGQRANPGVGAFPGVVVPWGFACTLGLRVCPGVGVPWGCVCTLGLVFPGAACVPWGWCSLGLRVFPGVGVPWGWCSLGLRVPWGRVYTLRCMCTLGLVRSLGLVCSLLWFPGAACVSWRVVTLHVPGAGGGYGTLGEVALWIPRACGQFGNLSLGRCIDPRVGGSLGTPGLVFTLGKWSDA